MTDDVFTFYGTSDKIVLLNSNVSYFTFELIETELFLTKLMLADLKGVFCCKQSPGMADENLRPSSGKPTFKASKDPVILHRNYRLLVIFRNHAVHLPTCLTYTHQFCSPGV